MRTLPILSLAALAAFAVETRYWQLQTKADVEKGTFKRLALRSDGRISLSPAAREVLDSSTPYLWALASDSKGNIYAAGGGPGASKTKLFAIDPAGKSRVLAELDGMQIQAVAVDSRNHVYAATSPDGKVWRVDPAGKAEAYYEPGTKYIWALAFSAKGDLFVATGDQGEIHRVSAAGQGSVFFRTEETHARSLAVDTHENLIVGTEPGGLIIRISPAGEGFVLHQAGRREVTAVVVASDGVIYAAATGTKPAPPPAPPASAAPAPASAAPAAPTAMTPVQSRQAAPPPPTFTPSGPAVSGGSEVIRIGSDGFPRGIWQDPQEIVYALTLDSRGFPVVGTGNRGQLIRIDSELLSTRLLTTDSTQITALCRGQDGRLFAATGNIGKVYQVGPGLETEGYFESEPLDAGIFSQWGRLIPYLDANGGAVHFETRSGNLDRPQKNWSQWAPVNDRVQSPPSRFLQWKVTFSATPGGKQSPELRGIEVAYLTRNVAPQVEEIEITPANYRFPAQILTLTPSQNLTLPPLGQPRRASTPLAADSSITMNYAKGHLGARWRASDPNGDTLSFKIEIRGASESEWKLLKDSVKEKQFSWDSTAFPDGQYRLRITASDEPENPPAQALTSALESDLFWVDNSAPRISALSGSLRGGKLTVRWKASDESSTITNAEYSVDGGEWAVVEPVSRLSDSRELDYSLQLDKGPAIETTVAVRVTDEFENKTVEKILVK
jgi:sugar lactone lactonase YvrE